MRKLLASRTLHPPAATMSVPRVSRACYIADHLYIIGTGITAEDTTHISRHGLWTETRQRLNSRSTSRRRQVPRRLLQSRSMFAVRTNCPMLFQISPNAHDGTIECIVYTHDYHSSMSIWSGLRVQPILSDEVQTFKALITVHKILQEGHPIVCHRHLDVTGWRAAYRVTVSRPSRRHRRRPDGSKPAPAPFPRTASAV